MHDALMLYFDGEKYAGLFLAGAGALIIVAASLLLAKPSLRSFAVTLIALALAEIALGVGLYLRTGPQVSRLITQMGADAAGFYSGENARMDRVQRNFVIVEYVELAIIVLAAAIAIFLKGRPVVMGIALGFLIHAALLLAFDLIAERRGDAYLKAIQAQGRTASI